MTIVEYTPERKRGKWDFIPNLPYQKAMLFETERECDCARRALIWHGFKTAQKKTRDGWYIWKLPNENTN